MHSKEYYIKRLASLDLERQSFIPHWKELSEFVRPRRGRFFIQDRNKGTKRHQAIINSKATKSLQVATAGMLAGTISPSRPWFSLETHDPDLMRHGAVKTWLFQVETLLRSILNESNFYGTASQALTELLLFGTAAMTHVDDFEDVARFYCHTVGSYHIGVNERQEGDTLYRDYEMTVRNMADKFGAEKLSRAAREAYDRGDYDRWFPVCHAIEPNNDFLPRSGSSKNKKYISVYFEPGNMGEDRDKYLRVAGFDEFPGYILRWEVTGEDIYGTDCPGMTALGDIKMLQIEERRKAQAIDKMVNPPLTGPAALRNVPVSQLPGGMILYDGDDQRQKLRPLHDMNISLQELRLDMEAVEYRISEAFFVDMFLAISQMKGIQPRNEMDLLHRNEERLLQLGPVLERIHSELLDKLIDRTFQQAVRAGILPPAPPELAKQALKVKYISTLAMAQRAVATQSIDRVVGMAGTLIQMGLQDASDKVKSDRILDEYAQAVGAPPGILLSEEEMAQVKQQKQEQMQQQQALEQGSQMATMARDASQAKLDDRSLLTEMAQQ